MAISDINAQCANVTMSMNLCYTELRIFGHYYCYAISKCGDFKQVKCKRDALQYSSYIHR